jgi:hypothetical protein
VRARPYLFDVDTSVDPPTMTLCFAGDPDRFATLRIRSRVTTLDKAVPAAQGELAAFTDDEIALVDEIARPGRCGERWSTLAELWYRAHPGRPAA